MYNILKKRRKELDQDKAAAPKAPPTYARSDEPLKLRAADRLDRLKTSDKGPFMQEPEEPPAEKPAVAPGPHPAEGEPITGTPEPGISMSPRDHGDAAKHHMSLRDIYRKYTKPAQDTIPHTDRINEEEKRELGPEIDMERPK